MEYTALYRQWRPETFDDMVGQDSIVRTLKNQIKSGRIAHAYLFCGSRGTGKTSAAKILARAVNCISPKDASPCGECRVCKQLKDGNNMDIIEIDAASNNGVDEIRDLRDKVKYPPTVGRYKVYIIDEVHMLSIGAFNALLKTLEEPPAHVIFILATTEPHKLPSTIISRCQRFDFKRIPHRVIMERLEMIAQASSFNIDEEAIDTIARWSEGGMRDALSLMDECVGFCGEHISNSDVLAILGTADQRFIFEFADNMLENNVSALFEMINDIIEDGKNISVFLKDIIYHMRNLMLIKVCGVKNDLLDMSDATLKDYGLQAQRASIEKITRIVDILTGLDSQLKWSTQPRVLLELAMVKICRPDEEQSYEAIIERLKALEQGMVSIPKQPQVMQQNKEKKVAKPKEEAGERKKEVQKKEKTADKINSKKAVSTQNNGKSIEESWPDIMNEIKKERMPIYTLLREAKVSQSGEGKVILKFAPDQGFYAAAIEMDDKRTFIQDMIYKMTGKNVIVACQLGESSNTSDEDDDVVKKAIEIFGEQFVEVVEEDD
ncbi:DNA polymerase III subunit gamma/tau [Xylanivirga thermophila]|uniref:DNA polymerase III subunit gamma/tau n=1 Tax=Xylanivirga thermophila TaxID=2496273 RepID=UPI0013EB9BFB|nr:DNA polymerase III subunit gamma/tau [Xylanivirga thermophila]